VKNVLLKYCEYKNIIKGIILNMSKPYIIKNKVLRIAQDLLDEIKAHPENVNEIYKKFDSVISKDDIEDKKLKEVIEKIINEFKDTSYYEMFDKLKKNEDI
jgi:hypothetical protein